MQWMREVFASIDMDNRARVLGVIHDFLLAEVDKKSARCESHGWYHS